MLLMLKETLVRAPFNNRLRYVTPNVELPVRMVSEQEVAEYTRYKQRYEDYWLGKDVFNPIATRITIDDDVRLETCVLPLCPTVAFSRIFVRWSTRMRAD